MSGHIQVPGTAIKCGFLTSHRKEPRVSHRRVKEGLFREETHSLDRVRPSQKAREAPRYGGCQFLWAWVISWVNEREEYSNYLGEGMGIPGSGPAPTF